MSEEEAALVGGGEDALLGRGCRVFWRWRWRAHGEGRVADSALLPSPLLLRAWRVLLAALAALLFAVAAPIDLVVDRPVFFLVTFSYVCLVQQVLTCLTLLCLTFVQHWQDRWSGLCVALLQIACVNSALVLGIYWGMLAPRFEWNQFLVHGVNMILLMMELVVDDVAFVPAQIVLVLAFDLLYFVLVLVPFQAATGLVIYPGITDFEAFPGRAVLALFGIGAAAIVIFALLVALTHLKCQFAPVAAQTNRFVLWRRK